LVDTVAREVRSRMMSAVKGKNAEYKKALQAPLKSSDFKNKSPRILVRVETYLKDSEASSEPFSHYRPARYFHENLEILAKNISDATKDRFEKAFKDLNGLLPS
jgi:hypothetical protein